MQAIRKDKRRASSFGKIAVLGAGLMLMAGVNSASASSALTVLHSFSGYPTDGETPYAGLVADDQGNLYGTTAFGGATLGEGVVFKLSPSGAFTLLHSFTGGKDGGQPNAGLVVDRSGNLYGTASFGGVSGCGGYGLGCGTVFKLTTDGTFTVLHTFTGGSDGAEPVAGLILDHAAGNLYGPAYSGGTPACGDPFGCGTIFKLSMDGTFTVLHTFLGGSSGAYPNSSLIANRNGVLHGTTWRGGTSNVGTVFKGARTGTYTVLHSFTGGSDGAFPSGGLFADSKGDLYGTASYGGAGCSLNKTGCGVVFKLHPGAALTVLHSFKGYDGAIPFGSLIADKKGDLFGTTDLGGEFKKGAIFKLSVSGAFTLLHSFMGGSDGSGSTSGLIADSKGNLFGTTPSGGASDDGTIYKLSGTGFVPEP